MNELILVYLQCKSCRIIAKGSKVRKIMQEGYKICISNPELISCKILERFAFPYSCRKFTDLNIICVNI